MPFTKEESKHYLEQISYHTLIFTNETDQEKPGKNRFPRGGHCNENKSSGLSHSMFEQREYRRTEETKDKIGFYTEETSVRLILDSFKVGNVVQFQGNNFYEQIQFSTYFDAGRFFPSSEEIF